MKYPKMLGSSVNSEKLALTVKGILVGLVPVIIILAKSFGVDLNGETVNIAINTLVNSITAIGLAVSAIMTFIGAVRKIIVAFKK